MIEVVEKTRELGEAIVASKEYREMQRRRRKAIRRPFSWKTVSVRQSDCCSGKQRMHADRNCPCSLRHSNRAWPRCRSLNAATGHGKDFPA